MDRRPFRLITSNVLISCRGSDPTLWTVGLLLETTQKFCKLFDCLSWPDDLLSAALETTAHFLSAAAATAAATAAGGRRHIKNIGNGSIIRDTKATIGPAIGGRD
jgi:hypothetical protein